MDADKLGWADGNGCIVPLRRLRPTRSMGLRPTPGLFPKTRREFMALAKLLPQLRQHRHPEKPAVPLEIGDENREVRDADAQHCSDEPLKRMALPTRTRRAFGHFALTWYLRAA